MTSSEGQHFGIVLLYCSNDPSSPGRQKLLQDDVLDYYEDVMTIPGGDYSLLELGGGNDYDTKITHFPCCSNEEEEVCYERLVKFYAVVNDTDDEYGYDYNWYVFRISRVHDMWMLKRFQESRKFDPVKNPPSALENMAVLSFTLENKPVTFQSDSSLTLCPKQGEEHTVLEEEDCISPLDLYEGEEETKEEYESSS